MADTDFVTEAQMNALVATLYTNANTATSSRAVWVFHGATAGTARPNTNGAPVIWVGTVEPTNKVTNDCFWDET